MNAAGVLRIPKEVELAGLDYLDDEATNADRQEIVNAELAESKKLK